MSSILSAWFKYLTIGMFILVSGQTLAQLPLITSSIGMPVGSTSSKGIAFGNGVYISIFSSGRIYSSSDGVIWSRVNDPGISPGTFNGITFGSGTFVVIGDGGLILKSSNGLNWTSENSGTNENLLDIQFFSNAFYAVGNNSTLVTSSNGMNWSTVTIGIGASTDTFNSIAYGNGVFVISSQSASGDGLYVFSSATATSNSWLVQYAGSGLINKIEFLMDRFFMFTSGTDVYTSPDAAAWTNRTNSMILTLPDATTQTIGSPNQAFNGIYDGNKIYLFGYSQYYSSYGSIFSSTDGLNFTLEPKTAYIVCQGSAYVNNKYFQYGNEGFVLSSDGLNYEYPSGNYNGLASNGSTYVAVGASVQAGVISTSTDFITWTDRTPDNQKELNTVVYTGTKFVAAGNQTVIESMDGISWVPLVNLPDNFTALDYGLSLLVAGRSETNTLTGNIAYSSDGINWMTANSDDNYYFKMRFINGNFFALGFSNSSFQGVILHSSDGINWTDVTPALPYPVYCFNDVVYDGSKYYFMGMDWADLASYTLGQFFSVSTATINDPNSYSNKGTISSTPSGVSLGSSYGESVFAYSNGRFTGSVIDIATNEAYIIYSADALNWTAVDSHEKTSLFGLISEGDKFKFVGSSDAKVIADFSSTLPVNLLSFKASPVNGQSLLKWQTSGEINSDHFLVRHSTDAIKWYDIGNVRSSGQTDAIQTYQFIHRNPVAGKNYYQLIQTDVDGKIQISEIEQVQINSAASIRLFPNPAAKYVLLQLPDSQVSTVNLYNAGGQNVYHNTHIGNVRLSLAYFPPGVYHVVVYLNGKQYTQQLYHQ